MLGIDLNFRRYGISFELSKVEHEYINTHITWAVFYHLKEKVLKLIEYGSRNPINSHAVDYGRILC